MVWRWKRWLATFLLLPLLARAEGFPYKVGDTLPLGDALQNDLKQSAAGVKYLNGTNPALILAFAPTVSPRCAYARMMGTAFDLYFQKGLAFEDPKLSAQHPAIVLYSGDDPATAQTYLLAHNLSFPVIGDPKLERFAAARVPPAANDNADSVVMLVDAQHIIRYLSTDYRGNGEKLKVLEKTLHDLLAPAPAAQPAAPAAADVREFGLREGDLAPDIALSGAVAGRTIGDAKRLSDLRGKTVVVSFYPAPYSGVTPQDVTAWKIAAQESARKPAASSPTATPRVLYVSANFPSPVLSLTLNRQIIVMGQLPGALDSKRQTGGAGSENGRIFDPSLRSYSERNNALGPLSTDVLEVLRPTSDGALYHEDEFVSPTAPGPVGIVAGCGGQIGSFDQANQRAGIIIATPTQPNPIVISTVAVAPNKSILAAKTIPFAVDQPILRLTSPGPENAQAYLPSAASPDKFPAGLSLSNNLIPSRVTGYIFTGEKAIVTLASSGLDTLNVVNPLPDNEPDITHHPTRTNKETALPQAGESTPATTVSGAGCAGQIGGFNSSIGREVSPQNEAGTEVVMLMISTSTPELVRRWSNDLGVKNLAMMNDPEFRIASAFGSHNPAGYDDRTVLVVDKHGVISYINWAYEVGDKDLAILQEKIVEACRR